MTPTQDTSVEIREYRDTDLDAVLDLLRTALGESPLLRRTDALFRWKHIDNPFGRSLMFVAESSGRIVGFRAFMRWTLHTSNGEAISCVRAVDTATHPDFQRRGIFSKLTMAAIDHATSEGVDLVFNTPNPKSGAGYLKMGWHEVGGIGVLAAPSRGIFRRSPDAQQLPEADDFVARSVAPHPLEIEDRPARGLRTPRTSAYLSWRFAHPTAPYRFVRNDNSTAVVRPNIRSGRRELVLSDVFGPNPTAAIRSVVVGSRTAYVAGWFSEGSTERSAAMRSGMMPIPKITTLTLVARPLRELPVDTSTLGAWDLASSDLELL